MLYTSLSKFSETVQDLSQTTDCEIIILEGSKPIGVYLSIEKWQEIESNLQSKEITEKPKIDMTKFWKKAKHKLTGRSKGKVLSQEEIDLLSYVS